MSVKDSKATTTLNDYIPILYDALVVNIISNITKYLLCSLKVHPGHVSKDRIFRYFQYVHLILFIKAFGGEVETYVEGVPSGGDGGEYGRRMDTINLD